MIRGAGGGRIGGQKGFNNVETVISEYQNQIKNFVADILKKVNSINSELKIQLENLLAAYASGNVQVGINQNTKYEGKYQLADSVLLKIVQSVYDILGKPNPEIYNYLDTEIKRIYGDIWKSLVPSNTKIGVHKLMDKLLKVYFENRTISDMLNDNTIIAAEDFEGFSQSMCVIELAEYAALENFHYMFIIKANSDLTSGKMAIIANDYIQNLANTIVNDKMSYSNWAETKIKFKLPQTYGAASRAIRPDISLI